MYKKSLGLFGALCFLGCAFSLQASEPDMPVEFHKGVNSGNLTLSAEVEELVIDRKINKAGSALSNQAEGKKPNLVHQQSKHINVKQVPQAKNSAAVNAVSVSSRQKIDIAESLSSKAENFMRDDGFYSESIRVKARLKGAAENSDDLELQNWNYYQVKGGKAWKISADEYSKATDETFTIKRNGKSESYNQGGAEALDSGHQLESASSKKSFAIRADEPARAVESAGANQDQSESHEQ